MWEFCKRLCSLYKHKRINLGKNGASLTFLLLWELINQYYVRKNNESCEIITVYTVLFKVFSITYTSMCKQLLKRKEYTATNKYTCNWDRIILNCSWLKAMSYRKVEVHCSKNARVGLWKNSTLEPQAKNISLFIYLHKNVNI